MADSALTPIAAASAQAQSLLSEIKAKLGFAEGDSTMFIADQPATPPVVMVVSSGTAQPAAVGKSYAIGICKIVRPGEGQSMVTPIAGAQQALSFHNDPVNDRINLDDAATVRLIQPPQHGKVAVHDENGDWTTEITDWRSTEYVPDDGYEGSDSLIMQVEGGGYTVQVHYFFSVGTYANTNPDCKDKEFGVWSISSAFPQASSADDLFTLNGVPFNGYQLKNVDISLNFANLANGAVGETVGHNITLDDDGNGYREKVSGLREKVSGLHSCRIRQ